MVGVRWARRIGVVATAAAAGAWGSGGRAGAAPSTLFSSTNPGGATAAVTVPTGICFVSVTADAAGGGTGFFTPGPQGLGGFGAEVIARLAVTPGQALTLKVTVGGTGGDATGTAGGAGGLGGGGAGGGIGGAPAAPPAGRGRATAG